MDRTAAAAETQKVDLIDTVAGLAVARLKSESKAGIRAAEVAAFIRQFYAHVPPGDIQHRDATDLYGAALAFWKFARHRRPGIPKIRAYNPHFEEHGWQSVHTVVEIVNDDMPFLVDSVTAELNRRGYTVHLVIHPIVHVRRDKGGRLTALAERAVPAPKPAEGFAAESFMHVEIDEQTSKATLRDVEKGVAAVLADVRAAVEDWKAMHNKALEVVEDLTRNPPPLPKADVSEGREFLEWLTNDHFTFLGYREYRIVEQGGETRMTVVNGSGLGILRDPDFHIFEGVRDLGKLPEEVRDFLAQPRLLIINKANLRSTVHRPVHYDAIGIKLFDRRRRVVGERLFAGLFTSTVYSRSPRFIPALRVKLDRAMARSGLPPDSHAGKTLSHILTTFPRDELFQITDEDLYRIGMGILHLQERQRVAIFVRHDAFQRFISCLVYAPRERFDTFLRKRFEAVLEGAFNGVIAAFYTQIVDDSLLARVHFIVKTTPGQIPSYDIGEIEAWLADEARSWADNLRDDLIEHRGEEAGLKLLRRYGDAFPTSYKETTERRNALIDIDRIEDVLQTDKLGLNLYKSLETEEHEVRFKIYNDGGPVPLSDILPMLENMGLRAVDEVPHEVRPEGCPPVWIHDFGLVRPDGGPIDVGEIRGMFHDTFARVWYGEIEGDGFNALTVEAALDWREIVVLRAYAKYLRQTGVPFSQAYIEETLAANEPLAALIVRLFEARFDPERAESADKATRDIVARIEKGLEKVSSLDQDRIIRRFVNLVQSTLRANFYQTADDGRPKPYLSFKLDSRLIEDLPVPRPMVEIWVYSPRVEGVHLRFGKVARGGLRWSDRREDFRTEVLGLAKAQVVKNAVIVPVGSKGGFVVKRPPPAGGREALQEEGVECYKTLIRGMLDLTENLVGDDVVTPPRVVRYDGDDPYLVVAADKGTATFSDIANGVSAEYGFWLGDAFASGGSAGYDHKAMGITARGAWEAVKRHFRDAGKDIQSLDFTVIGIGDMSGDVFGNGMLLSRHIRLIGAFNHMHIFVDPDPDPESSFAERRRLFEKARSSWADYAPDLISKGGGVFERKAKSIAPTPEIRALFGIRRDSLTPNELIRHMLAAEVELLWFAGIGTYVKARGETDTEVGDRSNDAVRIEAGGVKARVIGEGANLGVTQKGRIQFARRGGRINTDAVDNSAGVDCSDHEVNIKILLGDVVARGDMTGKQRDKLLEDMTDEVARLVLRDNYLQTQAISVTESLGVTMLERQARFMRALEREGKLDRAVEDLPDDEEIAERAAARQGLTRPEIAVLLAYAKIDLFDDLLACDLPDHPHMEQDLLRYFPEPLQRDHAEAARRHRLRREIIATQVTNSLINRAGITFVNDIVAETGMPVGDVARAYVVSRDALDHRALWAGIEDLDNMVPSRLQTEMLLDIGRIIKRSTMWFLRYGGQPLDIGANIGVYGPGMTAFRACIADVLSETQHEDFAASALRLTEEGVPEDVALKAASLSVTLSGLDVVRLATDLGIEIEAAGRAYFAIGETLGIDWLRATAASMAAERYWDKLAVSAILDELYGHQSELTREVIESAGGRLPEPDKAIEVWIAGRETVARQTARLLDELRGAGTVDLAMLAVVSRQLRALIAR